MLDCTSNKSNIPENFNRARRWSPARGGTPGKGHKNKCEPRRGGIKRGAKYGIVSKRRNHRKHAPTTARSSRLRVSLRSLATPWPAASLRSSPLYVGLRCVASLRRSGLNFLFLRYPGFRGFAAPPPGYYMAPLRGSELGSPAARKLFFNFRFIEQCEIPKYSYYGQKAPT